MNAVQLSDTISLQLQDAANRHQTTIDDLLVKLLENDQIHTPNPEHQHTNEHIQLAISAARMGIWTLDIATGALEWNDELLSIYGMTREEFKYQVGSFQDRVHPADREYVQSRINEAFAGTRVLDVMFRIVHPDQGIRYISGAATPIIRDGEVVMVIGNNLDITEIKHAQQLIINQTAIIENISDAIVVTNLNFEIIAWNKGAEKLYGFLADEVLNKPIASVLQTIYPSDTESSADTQLRDKGYWQGEVLQMTRTGEQLFISSSVTMIQPDPTIPPVIAAINRDITARKRAEQLELAQETLRQSVEQAHQTAAFRAKMLSVVAHEFRTPLAIIQASSEILVRYGDQIPLDRKIASMENIQREIAYITEMLTDLQLIARSQRQSMVLKLEKMEINTLINSLMLTLTNTLKPTQTLALDVPETLGWITLDPHLIHIALSNLISNAVKYSPDNGQITVKASKTSHDLILTIIDQGIGVSEADQDYIFEPFYRGENASAIAGSGLGLSIVKEIAQLHGGFIICESTVGVYSAFNLCLPLSRAESHHAVSSSEMK